MQAYKFETKISKTGQIKLPLNSQLFDKEVEIIIVPKQEIKTTKLKASDFIDKWSGFLSNTDTDDLKYRYLTDKYK
ncbi:MAG TPA: hypothetical protein VE912_14285 [Bacteroidales bacterium]|nr:hypothetical protein [Bacteroidales bacterium]